MSDTINLREGDYVRRKLASPYLDDPYQCHPASFGKVVYFVEESKETRSDNPHIEADDGDTWIEIGIEPFSRLMQPRNSGVIQWTEDECVKISRLHYILRALLWPLLWLCYPVKLKGQSTNIQLVY